MKLHRLAKLLAAVLVATGVVTAAYLTSDFWLPWLLHNAAETAATSGETTTTPTTRVIVGDQAQKNLALTAEQLKAGTVWKSMTVPGMVVDRPGVSDREVVAPATAVVSAIHQVPGDTVRPGDVLFTLKLLSESLHQAQTELFKAIHDIQFSQAELKRMAKATGVIPEARFLEVDNQIKRLTITVKAYRLELLNRGLSADEVDGVAEGKFVSEISVTVPQATAGQKPLTVGLVTKEKSEALTVPPLAFEVQDLKVELGQQVQAGQTLCRLGNHQSLSINGRAFPDEIPLLERSFKEGWPVEANFQEGSTGWGEFKQPLTINHIANHIDPVKRTFAFQLSLENQSKAVQQDGKTKLLWRFRPGQKVKLRVWVEPVQNVFVLPPAAVAREGPEAYVFTQNVNTFERHSVHVVYQTTDWVALANDGALPTYEKDKEVWTIPSVVQTAAAQLNRMAKAGGTSVPKGYHIHADGSLHKNEDEGK